MTANQRLESWLAEHKSHSVNLEHDNGYGASCWVVTLHAGKRKLIVVEVNFTTAPARYEDDESVCLCMPDSEDRPGLDAVINFALDHVNELKKDKQ